ncbi:similar to Saccharomyces cerevisiae YDR054C CDC34 Ubiquitin-conjugating enzyme (E2) and catalytic subunit of SCF ubiquitin-protein ligase complex [Maudiozyma saulgeensis]|uniref:Similar to Saccharomyces cerevisiae YDR054C CDC34 Ubiquitin-conjugating enzyme (E2) and catalytic subunit of SCF ubiquitin-protein ligase complex n=1 Tax=Maudiozyma saulgeensis TaxID=1789683 RepID=A0A1X7R3R9_9SACH|nr:similar to Saccharomyces cerevisiae YDR054C CDC34 Ubiquitin-conjugating enzyme (E2) and catalytic subunit of SCF ubiquitin-protein ligase complex [Kazachstania saulgeensis]
MSNRKSSAASLLLRQYRELTDPKKAIPSFHIELDDDSNIFVWNIGVMVLNEDSIYHGGYFKAQMRFPEDFPFSPPQFRFTPAIYHPNVYRDGRLCISILHQSGDPMADEIDAETWSPVQTVESVLISIVSLLEDPNVSSPANVDAAVDYRKNPDQYKQRVKMEVERSKQDIPAGFVMPSSDTAYLSSRQTSANGRNGLDDLNQFDENGNNNNSNGNNNNNGSNSNSNSNNIGENFWYDSDDEQNISDFINDDNDDKSMGFNDDDVYNYKGYDEDDEQDIQFDDEDEDEEEDDDSIDSVMDRKQPNKAGDESEDVEEMEKLDKK